MNMIKDAHEKTAHGKPCWDESQWSSCCCRSAAAAKALQRSRQLVVNLGSYSADHALSEADGRRHRRAVKRRPSSQGGWALTIVDLALDHAVCSDIRIQHSLLVVVLRTRGRLPRGLQIVGGRWSRDQSLGVIRRSEFHHQSQQPRRLLYHRATPSTVHTTSTTLPLRLIITKRRQLNLLISHCSWRKNAVVIIKPPLATARAA